MYFVSYLCSENKDADQLCGYHIVFVYMQKSGFLTTRLTWLLGMVLLMVTLYWTLPGLKVDPP